MNKLRFLAVLFFAVTSLNAQKKGCTDPQATNFDPLALTNDGTCVYKSTFSSPKKICTKLSDTIQETSGMIYYNGYFWTHNDSDNPAEFYAFDSLNGRILHTVVLANSLNKDWEDMTQDLDHIFIGEFGNNSGNRKDLKILKIKKSDLFKHPNRDTVNATFIRFEMSEQTDFTDNFINNDFDMEAMFYKDDSLNLFSKNWIDKKTRHYVCPIDTGFYSLTAVETIQVEGQISGACVGADGTVALIGYTKPAYPCFIWLFWDYSSNRFNTGNRRKVEMGNTLFPGQTESIVILGKSIYLTNENKIVNQQLLRLDFERWTDSLTQNSIGDTFYERTRLYYANKQLKIWSLDLQEGMYIDIYDNTGKKIHHFEIHKVDSETCAPIEVELPDGIYIIRCQKVVLGKVLSY